MDFKIGDTYKAKLWGRKYKIHICAVVDERQICFKWYGKHKQWWHYQVEDMDYLTYLIGLAEN